MSLFDDKIISDEGLVDLMRENNPRAFETLYDRYAEGMFRFFYLQLGDREKAEDFLQNIFVKLIEKADSFDSSRKFSTWFYTIAHNLFKNEFRNNERRLAREKEYTISNSHLNSSSEYDYLDSDGFYENLNLSLAELNSDQRTSFILRFKYQFSIKEISKVLDCSEGTTKSRLFYALKKLASQLKHFNPYSS